MFLSITSLKMAEKARNMSEDYTYLYTYLYIVICLPVLEYMRTVMSYLEFRM